VSRYEALRTELRGLRVRQACSVMAPTAAAAVVVADAAETSGAKMLAVLVVLVVLPLVLHRLWRAVFPAYRTWSDQASQIAVEILHLRNRIDGIFERYRDRQKGEHFKKAYDLNGRSIRDLEEALSVGMYRERREVFVTAFIRAGVAVRVTASIGSPFRCSAADNPARWRDHLDRLGCDEIRQYHNHPIHNGRTGPSSVDVKTSGSLKSLLGTRGSQLRSLIICWNRLREWKVFEHDETGRTWLHFEFDAAG
jgi:hypothetical protein